MRKFVILAGLAAAVAPVAVAAPARAQSAIEGRVDRLEREMRAVQRKVFPGGNGQYLQPDIAAPGASGQTPGVPSSSPVIDLDARVVALEKQLGTMTGSIEQTQFRVRQLEEAFNAYKRSTDARLKALEDGATQVGAAPVAGDPKPATTRPATAAATTAIPKPTGPAPVTTKPVAPKPVAADPGRAARLAAVEKPSSGEIVEDDYIYGYRLWQAKLYPEAQTALKAVVEKYPRSRRASFAQNLLGRAYLDEGRPSLASIAFYDSFKKFPEGERAPESLYYLAQSLMKLNKPADACKVYAELDETYATKIDAPMRANIVKGRAAAKCP